MSDRGPCDTGLPRILGLGDAVGVIVGIVIGSGIFMVAAPMTQKVSSPLLVILVWIVGALVSFVGGLTFAELGTRYPEAGGMYVYLRESFGTLCAFLYGWTFFLVVQTGSIAAVAVAFSEHVAVLWPMSARSVVAVAIALVLFLSAVNAASTRASAWVQNLATVTKCAALVALVAAALAWGRPDPSHLLPLFPGQGVSVGFLVAIGSALMAALWAYDGWHQVGNLAGELEEPGRDVPRALFIGLSIVAVLYVSVSAAYFLVLPPATVAGSKRVAADVARALFSDQGATWIATAIMVSTFGCVNGMTLAGPRVYYAMAADGLFFASLGRPHPVYRTPAAAVLAQGAWSALLVLWGNYEELLNYVMFVAWLFYGLVGVGLFVERRLRPDHGGYLAWGYPATPAVFVLASGFLLVTTLVAYPTESLAGLAILLAGVPAHAIWARRRAAAGSDARSTPSAPGGSPGRTVR